MGLMWAVRAWLRQGGTLEVVVHEVTLLHAEALKKGRWDSQLAAGRGGSGTARRPESPGYS